MVSTLKGICYVRIPVHNIQRAVKWYGDVFGASRSAYSWDKLVELELPDFSGPEILLSETSDAARLRFADSHGRPESAFSFITDNPKDVYDSLQRHGARILEFNKNEDGDGSILFEDVDGNVLAVMWRDWPEK